MRDDRSRSRDVSLSPPGSPTPTDVLCGSMSSRSFRMPSPGSPSNAPSPPSSATELDLRLFSYRDTTPLRGGQVDDEPYGGGAGMVLRVDVVAAALEAAYGGDPAHRVVALTPQGRLLDAATWSRSSRRSRAAGPALRALRGVRRADRRAPRKRRDLDRSLRALERRPAGDGARRRDRTAAPGRAGGRVRRARSRSRRSSAAGSSTRTTRGPRSSGAGRCRTSCSPATMAGSRAGARSTSGEEPDRPPDGRATARLARDDRLARHDRRGDRDRACDQAWVINPYRIPSSSMEPTLHCARPGSECEARLLGPRPRLPLLLPLLVAEAGRHRRLQDPAARRHPLRRGGRRSSSG